MRWGILKSKKSRAILRNLILAEIIAYMAFMLLALAADWGQLYEDFIFSNYVPFEVIEFSFLGLFQLGLIFLVFMIETGEEKDIAEMMESGEHDKLEFKTSLRWDVQRQQVNKELEKTVMKTVAAFLNSEGGHLLIGVSDSGQPIGLESDFHSLPKCDSDGFENHFNNLFNNMIGPEFRRKVRLKFSNIWGKTICLVNIESSHKPVYLKTGNSEDFYIRTGNVTTPLRMSEVATYVSSWWKNK